MSHGECFLILGGAGLTGRQVGREIAKKLSPRRIILCSLYEKEAQEAVQELRAVFSDSPATWEAAWGNIFVSEQYAHTARAELLADPACRQELYNDLFGGLDEAYKRSYLVKLLRQYRPDVVIDSINTATAISYQDVVTASAMAQRGMQQLQTAFVEGNAAEHLPETQAAVDTLLLSQSLPQLVRHCQLLYRVMTEVGTRLYIKIGTTGTGGMGLNIPYTHSEDKPSIKLMTKTAVAFAHTGLMFLMARTPGPIVKEVKPGAMIGYADVTRRTVTERGQPVQRYTSRSIPLVGQLVLRESGELYQPLTTLDLPVVDTGENGLFTKGEFEAITALRQMEFLTPEEIAREIVLEIRGSNTGHDVIAEIDSGVMNPTYRAGYLRQQVLEDMARLERETGSYSIALGQLGPPELSKLLWEAELLRLEYGTLAAVLAAAPEQISQQVYGRIQRDDELCQSITSIGLPLLSPDGRQLIRGPFIRIPELPGQQQVDITAADVDRWAARGWVDLRPANFVRWQERFAVMQHNRQQLRGRGSAAVSREAYLYEDIRIGEIVGWIFNNEENGYRIK